MNYNVDNCVDNGLITLWIIVNKQKVTLQL